MAMRWAVWERDNYTCLRCGSRTRLSIDHVVPECVGGETTVDNLQTLCWPCNCKKGRYDPRAADERSIDYGDMDSLKVARIRADVKLNEASLALGVEEATLWRWETGRSPIPGWALLQLACLYEIDPRTLMIPRPARKSADSPPAP